MREYIIPIDQNLSFREIGILFKMLNLPENDYLTLAEISEYVAPADSKRTVTETVKLLHLKGYLLKNDNVYSINKLKIPEMSIVNGSTLHQFNATKNV